MFLRKIANVLECDVKAERSAKVFKNVDERPEEVSSL